MKIHPDIDQQRDFYDQTWLKVAQSRYRQQQLKNRIHAITSFVKTLDLDRPRLLEIGCGLGPIAGELAVFGEVTAMDLSQKAIAIAKELYPRVNFFAADAMTYPFPSETYDVVVTSEVVEHLPAKNREQFVDILAHTLVPGGHLILTTPNKTLSDRLLKHQPIEEHFHGSDLKGLLLPKFQILVLSSVHRIFPVLGHQSKFFQGLRLIIYEILRLRGILEDPLRISQKGLYFVVLARKSKTS